MRLTKRRLQFLTLGLHLGLARRPAPRSTLNTTRSFSSGLFFEAFAMLISLRQTQTAD